MHVGKDWKGEVNVQVFHEVILIGEQTKDVIKSEPNRQYLNNNSKACKVKSLDFYSILLMNCIV